MANKTDIPVVQRSLWSWVMPGNMKWQIALLVVIVVTVLARVLPLEMQKRIINEAIRLQKMELLLIYCGIYLVSVLIASGLKYLITFIQTRISQIVLARMRRQLYHHILTLPLNFFRRTQAGMVVSSLITEITTAGNFAGMAIGTPVTSILTLLAFAGYLFWLNPLLAGISLSIYPLVMFLIPLLQKKANKANKRRVDMTRGLSNTISESVTGIHEIQSNGAFEIENNRYDSWVNQLYKVRIRWTLLSQGIKVTNNFFNSLGPFLIFILGGYLAMQGRLELGALVAFLSAQEKLYDPWKEMIEFYQVYQDAKVRYTRTMSYFDLEPEFKLLPDQRSPLELKPHLEVQGMSFSTETGIKLLDQVSLSLKPGEHLAVVGFSGSGKSTLAQCIGQLYKYQDGHIYLDGKEVADLTRRDMIENMGFISQVPFIFSGTIQDNLTYAYRARKPMDAPADKEHLPTLDDMIKALQQSGIFVDVLRFGLNTILTPSEDSRLAATIVKIRQNFQRDFGKSLADYVEFFSQDQYLYHSSILANITFGSPNLKEYEQNVLPRHPYFLKFLKSADLTRPLLGLGAELAAQTVDILGNLPPDEVFFEQSAIGPNELEEFKPLVNQLQKLKLHELSSEDRQKLLELALRFTPGRHKLIGLPQIIERLILEGRALFREKIMKDAPEAFAFYQMPEYIYSQTILNNILFGKPKTATSAAQEKINQNIIQLLIEENLLETITEIGMQFEVGSKGDKLSGGQRQKLAISRAFLKSPRLMIMDEATSALDNKSQARIQRLLENQWRGKSTVIAVIHRLDTIKTFDKVAVMKAGKIVEMGPYDQLMAKKGILYELIGKG